jgi:hypothetical protein
MPSQTKVSPRRGDKKMERYGEALIRIVLAERES